MRFSQTEVSVVRVVGSPEISRPPYFFFEPPFEPPFDPPPPFEPLPPLDPPPFEPPPLFVAIMFHRSFWVIGYDHKMM